MNLRHRTRFAVLRSSKSKSRQDVLRGRPTSAHFPRHKTIERKPRSRMNGSKLVHMYIAGSMSAWRAAPCHADEKLAWTCDILRDVTRRCGVLADDGLAIRGLVTSILGDEETRRQRRRRTRRRYALRLRTIHTATRNVKLASQACSHKHRIRSRTRITKHM